MRIEELRAKLEAGDNSDLIAVAVEVDPPHILALNVYHLRNARGMTQADLAQALGVAQPRIAEIERGDANPRLVTLSRIAHALGVALPELLVDNLNVPVPAPGEESMALATDEGEKPRKRQAV